MPKGKHLLMIVGASLATMYIIRYLRAGNTSLAGIANQIWPVTYATTNPAGTGSTANQVA